MNKTTVKYRRRWLTLLVLCLSLAFIALSNTALNIALPTLLQTFEASASELQWMINSYLLVFAGLLLSMGALGDRFGRGKALVVGLVIFGVASGFAAYAGSAAQVIAARAVMGVSGALIMPATLSIIVDVFPVDERGKAIGIWTAVVGLGVGFGPLLGGVLLDSFWWGSVFLINVPVAVIALVAGYWLVPDSADPATPPLDLWGAVLSMGAVSALVASVIEAPGRGWTDAYVVGGFVASAVLCVVFVWWQLRSEHPMLDLSFFKNPRFSVGAGAIAISFFGLFGSMFLLTLYLQFVQGYTPLEAGLRVSPIAVGIAIGAGRSDAMVRRFGTTRVVAGAFVGFAVVLVSKALWTVTTPYWIIGLVILLLAFFFGNIMAPATDAVMGAVPDAKAGIGSGTKDAHGQVGGALGIAVIGSALNATYSASMADAVAGLPGPAADVASDSVGAALRVAAQLPPDVGQALVDSARTAFMDGYGIAVLIAGGVALVGAVVTARFLPAHRLPQVANADQDR